jgi:hypothetical protein
VLVRLDGVLVPSCRDLDVATMHDLHPSMSSSWTRNSATVAGSSLSGYLTRRSMLL